MTSQAPNDTIAAIGTPPGEGGLCVVRMSGPDTFAIADRVFGGTSRPSECGTHTIHHGHVIDPRSHERVDEVLMSVFRSPRTYTREDLIEFSGHGGMVPGGMILDVLIRSGARLAEPGEFTKRAFLNGRIDLLQAEAVGELIRARTDACARAALRQLNGTCSQQIDEFRIKLIQIIAYIEVTLDFTEEGIPDMTPRTFLDQLRPVREALGRLIKSSHETRVLRDGVRVALLGKPNVGKSSLLNMLTARDRAIVHPESGTTRDTIEESVDIEGVPVVFVDTAGIRKTSNRVEQQGVIRSRTELEQADIPLAVFDATSPPDDDDRQLVKMLSGRTAVFIFNKCDLDAYDPDAYLELTAGGRWIRTSAKHGEGLENLREAILQTARFDPAGFESGLVVNARQGELLDQAKTSLDRGIGVLEEGLGAEMAAVDLRECVHRLGVLVGKEIGDAVLDHVFSRFCIGK
ncbi:MAG: tRNA uridine-5-carboxymethylaminomethyl(34) synthesis GTPase MnmE [Gemmatimonadetes bacterium]|nr:tRNA uridine-5-carboxymethylaminomethyl(34) synthesis GTPase MnmE [Gemmatimonadota bacterium]